MICKLLGIVLEHHNATSDAVASAKILGDILEKNGVHTLKDIQEKYKVSPGRIGAYDYSPCRRSGCAARSETKEIDLNIEYVDDDFKGKHFVFTGTLLSMTRDKAQAVVQVGGGIPQNGVNKKTDYLVMGIQDYALLREDHLSGKARRAKELQAEGKDIKIIDEDEFIRMIDDDLYRLCFCCDKDAALSGA